MNFYDLTEICLKYIITFFIGVVIELKNTNLTIFLFFYIVSLTIIIAGIFFMVFLSKIMGHFSKIISDVFQTRNNHIMYKEIKDRDADRYHKLRTDFLISDCLKVICSKEFDNNINQIATKFEEVDAVFYTIYMLYYRTIITRADIENYIRCFSDYLEIYVAHLATLALAMYKKQPKYKYVEQQYKFWYQFIHKRTTLDYDY